MMNLQCQQFPLPKLVLMPLQDSKTFAGVALEDPWLSFQHESGPNYREIYIITACMYIRITITICVYTCMYIHTYIHTYIRTYVRTYMHASMHACITLRYVTLRYVTSLHVTSSHVTLRYIPFHSIAWHYVTLHYTTVQYIHTYTCIHVCVCIH